jgi:hypothetical protein
VSIVLVLALALAGVGCDALDDLDAWVAEQERLASGGAEESDASSAPDVSQPASSQEGPERIRPDQVEIQWVDVSDDYEKDIPTVVGVRYLLESEDHAILKVGFNSEEPNFYTVHPDARQEVRKGEGEYEFNITLDKQPDAWSDGTPFSIIVIMSKTDESSDLCSSRLELIESNVVPDQDESASSASEKNEEQVFYFLEDDNFYLGKDSPYKPVVALYDDNAFILSANLFEGMGYMEGTYSIDGDTCVFTVTNIAFKGFAGDDVKSFSMTIKDNTLTLMDDITIGATEKGSVFTLVEGKPDSFVGPDDPWQ